MMKTTKLKITKQEPHLKWSQLARRESSHAHVI